MSTMLCPESVIGAHSAERNGRCRWCGQRVEAPVPRPDRYPPSDLGEMYEYHYDPDWGGRRWDL